MNVAHVIHLYLIRCVAMRQPIRCEHNLGSSFQGASLDQTKFQSFESAFALSQNVDIIAQLFFMFPAGLELTERLVLLQASVSDFGFTEILADFSFGYL